MLPAFTAAMNMQEKDYAFREFYCKPYSRPQALQTRRYDRQYHGTFQSSRDEFNTCFDLDDLISDKIFSETNWRRMMAELKDLPTARDFFLWIKRRYFQSAPRDKFAYYNFDDVQHNYDLPDTHHQGNQDFRGTYSTGSQFFSSGNASYYRDHNTVSDEAYSYLNSNNTSSLASNVAQKYKQNHSQNDKTETVFIPRNPCILMERLKKDLIEDLKTNFNTKSGNKKRVQGNCEVVDLTDADTDDKPVNLSKNPIEVVKLVNSIEEDDICFAPYEDYESDFEYVDEDSILAKHQRNYRIIVEAKRLKTSHVKVTESSSLYDKQNSYDQGQFAGSISVSTAEKIRSNDIGHVNKTINNFIGPAGVEEEDNQLRINQELYLDDTFEQNEAIDYSMPSKTGRQKLDREKYEIDVEDKSAGTFHHDSHASVACRESIKRNCDTQDAPLTCCSSNEMNFSNGRILGNSSKNSTGPKKNFSGLVKSTANLGFCRPFSQNKETSVGEMRSEKWNCSDKVTAGSKTPCEELLQMLAMDKNCKIVEKNCVGKTGDVKKETTCKRIENKTLEEVIDCMITDIMDSE